MTATVGEGMILIEGGVARIGVITEAAVVVIATIVRAAEGAGMIAPTTEDLAPAPVPAAAAGMMSTAGRYPVVQVGLGRYRSPPHEMPFN